LKTLLKYKHFLASVSSTLKMLVMRCLYKLTMTFMQPDYKGEWIDGVEFYYRGKPMEEWDHINLTGTILREDVKSIRQ